MKLCTPHALLLAALSIACVPHAASAVELGSSKQFSTCMDKSGGVTSVSNGMDAPTRSGFDVPK